MSLAELAALGDIVSAFAVVASLFYLSRQINANTAALRAANAATVQANFQRLAGLYTEDREAGDIVIRGMQLDTSLTRAEKAAAYGWFFNCLKAGELAFRQFKAQQLDPEVWDVALVHFLAYWRTPGMRRYWEERKASFVPQFRSEMENWLAEETAAPIKRSDQFFDSASNQRPNAT